MRTIAHVSDLHFGRTDRAVLPALRAAIIAANPDVVVVSGDLTQRARSGEFEQARRFLDALPFPQIVVPGNHDVPLYNVLARGLQPFAKYRRYFQNELEPFFADAEIAVLGLNTARALTFKNGRINIQQIGQSCTRLDACPPGVTRVLVTHHPFEASDPRDLVGRARLAMAAFARCRVDLILSGHLHISRIGPSAVRYQLPGYSALLVQAGTATSTRRRGEVNAFNLIRIALPGIGVECCVWDGKGNFGVASSELFEFTAQGWAHVPAAGS